MILYICLTKNAMESAEHWDWTPTELQAQRRAYKETCAGVCAAYFVVILIAYILSLSV